MIFELTIEMIPIAKARPRKGKHGFYTPQKTKDAEQIIVIDGCTDCCGIKKIESLGIKTDMHIIASEYGIQKRSMGEPSYEEIETMVSAVKKAIGSTNPQ